MKNKKVFILFLCVLFAFIYMDKLEVTPIEEFNIVSGFGIDVYKNTNSYDEYRVSISIYDFKKKVKKISKIIQKITNIWEYPKEGSRVVTGKGKTIGETREERDLKSDKPILFGIQKVIILSEEDATYGLHNTVNMQFSSPQINDRGFVAVCKGKSEEILSFKVEGYASSADYIEGMLRHARDYNFFSKEYNLLNLYTKLDSEGENVVLPFIELKEGNIILSGMAAFKEGKMTCSLPMEESKIMNILREKDVNGVLSLQESADKYINYKATVKKKVKCIKEEEKFKFIIDLKFNGEIIGNTLYENIDKKNEKDFEKLMEKKIENQCNEFLNKMKNQYRVDFLNLGMYAAAKYGRETGIDWNEKVCDSDIKVKVKVKIDKVGIGYY